MNDTGTGSANGEGGNGDPAASGRRMHRPPRIDTIVGGALFVGVALLGMRVGADVAPLSGPAVLWSVVGFGGLLVLAAVLAAILRGARR